MTGFQPTRPSALPPPVASCLTDRVVVGAYYTNGVQLAEIVRIYPLGHIQIRDVVTEQIYGGSILQLRRYWWLVRGPVCA